MDQYLDKEVVISKQPEDKVELIVQACRERFPEYAHWTTTRIRYTLSFVISNIVNRLRFRIGYKNTLRFPESTLSRAGD